MILAWTGDVLSRGQAQNGVNFEFEVKFDIEGQGQSPPKTIGILTKVFYNYGPNLVILAWTGDELSRGQASDYRTHERTDGGTHRQTQPTTIPEGQNWPRVKKNRRDDLLMLVTICDDTWNVLNMQHISPNSKRWDYANMSGGGT